MILCKTYDECQQETQTLQICIQFSLCKHAFRTNNEKENADEDIYMDMILQKRSFLIRQWRATRSLAYELERIAVKKIDIGPFLLKKLRNYLNCIYLVLKKCCVLYVDVNPFDEFLFWGKSKFSPNLAELRRNEIALFHNASRHFIWLLEHKFIQNCLDYKTYNNMIYVNRIMLDRIQQFIVRLNPRNLRDLTKIITSITPDGRLIGL